MRHVKPEDIQFKESPSGEKFAVLIGRHPSVGGASFQTVAMVNLSPHQSSDPHFHKEREESYFIISGRGYAIIDQMRFEINKGDLIFTKPNEKHQFVNNSDVELNYLVLTSPQWILKIRINKWGIGEK